MNKKDRESGALAQVAELETLRERLSAREGELSRLQNALGASEEVVAKERVTKDEALASAAVAQGEVRVCVFRSGVTLFSDCLVVPYMERYYACVFKKTVTGVLFSGYVIKPGVPLLHLQQ
jgi:hypothetical protein